MIKLLNILKEMLTEISVEQLKTQFVDSNKISQEDFNNIIDTTPKTAYITWLSKKVADGIVKTEDTYKYKKYFLIFDRRKKEYPFNDINQYKTKNDIFQFINKSIEISNEELKDISKQKGISKTDKYKEFYIGSVNGFNVYELPQGRKNLYGTSCELGSGTEWCTATGKTREHFDKYISKGPLFIFIKPGSSEKYQFSYEENQFMDKNDDDIIISKPKETYNLFKFIKDNRPKYNIPFIYKYVFAPETISSNDLNIKGNLNLDQVYVISLPDNLKINGDLNLDNSQIKTLPNNLQVEGSVYLKNTLFYSLPDNLRIGENLDLNGSQIKTLPNNLQVGGYLNISNTLITSLPDDLQVGRGLFLSNTPITSLLNILKINGDLDLNGSQIKTLPNNLQVEGSLALSDTSITSLPDDLQVDKRLNLHNTPIISLPNGLKVGDTLYLSNTPLSKKYSKEKIMKIIKDKGGYVKNIFL